MKFPAGKTALGFLLLAGATAAANPPGIWLDVPFVRQTKNGCGAAAISMVMQYWNEAHAPALERRAAPARIAAELYSRQAKGIYASAMERYFRESGFRAYSFSGEWADLKENISKGRPLIVALAPRGRRVRLHYVVVAGVDWVHDFVFVNDPAERKLVKTERREFEKEWCGAGNWTLLAVPQ